ncbi:hypothetical protein AQJ11_03230 [Streptomyces corchorusii]|uniref:HK97 gp10 family phage protein n=2 Tax=Streptomyces TaxID=1883 RepID=A0A101QMB2_STRCK|nr:hypothetical protein [Streptomyces corchorusii]KUN32553.1 hypothetical protein AQJ11_03230 [Streptomyces corchorusii]
MSAEVRMEPGRIARFLRLRGGRVERKLRERTARVARIAEQEAPGSMGRYISWDVQQGPRGLEGVVRCDHPAVLYVLHGTRPHLIRPRRRNGVLRFEVGGEVVFTRLVRHPGTRANNFLGRALRMGR